MRLKSTEINTFVFQLPGPDLCAVLFRKGTEKCFLVRTSREMETAHTVLTLKRINFFEISISQSGFVTVYFPLKYSCFAENCFKHHVLLGTS